MKLIYQPKGKANEYCKWACNLYNGCSNLCSYCYNRTGMSYKLLGKAEPTLKSGIADETEALKIFRKEFDKLKDKIAVEGNELFFNFVSDPFLTDASSQLNMECIEYVMRTSTVHVRTLTKCAGNLIVWHDFIKPKYRERWHIGLTLTGFDDLEPNADRNESRIEAISILDDEGYLTWASIEPIIDLEKSRVMIQRAYNNGCRDFKIGLLSGKRTYTPESVKAFKDYIDGILPNCRILWKRSVLEYK